jgi:peptidoglycan/LPS O-acetylase OafA/YrhL
MVVTAISLPATLLLAALSYRYVERPILDGTPLFRPLRRAAQPAPEPAALNRA